MFFQSKIANLKSKIVRMEHDRFCMTRRDRLTSANLLFFACCLFVIAVQSHSFASLGDDIASTVEEELYRQCKRAYTEGNFAEASQYIERLLSLYPESDHAAEIVFIQAFLQPAVDTSIEMYRLIIEKFPNSKWTAKSHFELGQCYYLQGEYDKVLAHYENIIGSYPENETYWPARYWKCKGLIAKGDYGKAIIELHSLEGSGYTEIGKDMILMSLGNCYLGMEYYEHAAVSYRSLIESAPDSQWLSSAYFLLAKSLHNLGKVEDAKTLYEKVIEDYGQSIEARQILDSLPSIQPKRVEAQPAASKSVEATQALPSQVTPYFSIQVGAFSQERNAKNLTELLRKKGYFVNITAPSPGRSSLHKVRVGKYKTRSAALEAAQKLRKNERLDTEVVQQQTAAD